MKKYIYKAFISYRHHPFDKKIAEKLHKMIETFQAPPNLNLKREKWIVFRDQDELPLSNNLGDNIKRALEQSEYLIVICSLRFQDSRWCMEEIRYFKELHGGSTKNILAVLIDGTPEQCFPPELCFSTENNITIPVEPLAANITAQNTLGSIQLLKKEFLRIAAIFLDCGFDQLYQREKRRKRRLYIILGSLAFGILTLIAAISIYSAVTIFRQNQNLLAENSEHLTIQSSHLWENGKPIEAIETLLEALPSKEQNRPVSVNAEYLLSQQIGAYETSIFAPVVTFEHKHKVNELHYTGGGETILTKDSTGIYLWNKEDGSLLKKYTFNTQHMTLYVEDIPYKNAAVSEYAPLSSTYSESMNIVSGKAAIEYGAHLDPAIYLYDGGRIHCLDGKSGQIKWDYEYIKDCSLSRIYIKDSTPYIFTQKKEGNYYDTILVLDKTNGTVKDSIDCSTWNIPLGTSIAYYSEKWLCTSNGSPDYTVYKIIGNNILPKGTLKTDMAKNDRQFSKFIDDRFYIAYSYRDNESQHTNLCCINLENLQVLWNKTIAGSLISKSGFSGHGFLLEKEKTGNYTDIFVYSIHNYVCLMDAETGTIISTYTFEKDISNLHHSENGCIFLTTKARIEYAFNANHITGPIIDKLPVCCQIRTFLTDTDMLARSESEHLTQADDSVFTYLYRKTDNPDYLEITSESTNFSPAVWLNPSGTQAVIMSYKENTYSLLDLASMQATLKLSGVTPQNHNFIGFLDDTKCYFHDSSEHTIIYDITNDQTLSVLNDCYYDTSDNGKWFVSLRNNTYMITDKAGTSYAWNTSKQNIKIHQPILSGDGEHVAFSYTDIKNNSAYIAFHQMVDNKTHNLDTISEEQLELLSDIIWLENNTFAVIYKNGDIYIYDIAKEKCTKRSNYSSAFSAEPDSIHTIGNDDYLIFICNNDRIYKYNLNTGITDAEINLSLISGETLGSSVLNVYSNSAENTNTLILKMHIGTGWNDAWFLDLDSFAIRCRISNYWDYAAETRKILICNPNNGHFGFFPYYTTEELVAKGNHYLGR